MNRIRHLALLAFVLVLTPTLRGQAGTTGTVLGMVTDTTGAVIAIFSLRFKSVIVTKSATSHELADRRQEDRISRKPIPDRGRAVGNQEPAPRRLGEREAFSSSTLPRSGLERSRCAADASRVLEPA